MALRRTLARAPITSVGYIHRSNRMKIRLSISPPISYYSIYFLKSAKIIKTIKC